MPTPGNQSFSAGPSASIPAEEGIRGSDRNLELVGRVRSGDPAAFDELVRRHYRAAYAVALAVLCNRSDAEDVVQDACLTALERIDDCRDPRRFSGWLLQIVRNRAKNIRDYRQVRRTADLDADTVSSNHRNPQAQMESDEDSRRLLRALADLNPAQRCVVLLHDLEGWPHGDIAELLDFSEGMSRQHLFAARRVLRTQLAAVSSAGESV